MPPKRKQPDGTQVEAPLTRATRASTRGQKKDELETQPEKKKSAAKKASTSTTKGKHEAEELDDGPPAKKAKTTKAITKATKVNKAITKGALNDAASTVTSNGYKAESSKAVDSPASVEMKKAPPSTKFAFSPDAAAQLFATYADEAIPNVIGPEGLEKFCTEADIPMEGALPILLSWQINAQEMGQFEKAAWLYWCNSRKLSSLPAIKNALEELNALLIDGQPPVQKPSKKSDEPYDRTEYWQYASNPKNAFQKLYSYCFGLVKAPQSRNIDMDTAKAFWAVLLASKYTIMNDVLEFINDREDAYKAVNKDLWTMMLEFCETMKPDLDGYEADGAWPTLLDEFVAHTKSLKSTE